MKLALFIALLAAKAWGGCPTGCRGSWEFRDNFLSDCGETATLIENGTVPFNTTCNSLKGAGPFSDTNYLTAPSSFLTAISGATAWTIELNDVYFTSIANGPVLTYMTDGDTGFFQMLATGSLKYHKLGVNLLPTPTGSFTTGVCYSYLVFVFENSTGTIYWTGNNQTGPSAFNVPNNTVTAFAFGRYVAAGGFSLDGSIGRARYFTKAYRGPFPSTDSSDAGECEVEPCDLR